MQLNFIYQFFYFDVYVTQKWKISLRTFYDAKSSGFRHRIKAIWLKRRHEQGNIAEQEASNNAYYHFTMQFLHLIK